jgi:hypothetical protein
MIIKPAYLAVPDHSCQITAKIKDQHGERAVGSSGTDQLTQMFWVTVRAGILAGSTPNFPGRPNAAACCCAVAPNSDGLAGTSPRNEAKISLSYGCDHSTLAVSEGNRNLANDDYTHTPHVHDHARQIGRI